MTGRFSNINEEQCTHYASFLRNLNLPQANGLFWTLFFVVLILMIISSIQHHKSANLAVQTDAEKALPPSALKAQERRHKRLRQRYLGIAGLCFILSLVCAILECFALFNIEYCDGEDLMQLYWGFWSVLTMGSIIAILGVIVQFLIILSSVETPSWAVALGTPVLVFAAIGWMFKHFGRRVWGRCVGRAINDDSDDEDGTEGDADDSDICGVERWFSRAPTIVAIRNDSTVSTVRIKNTQNTSDKRVGLRRSSTF